MKNNTLKELEAISDELTKLGLTEPLPRIRREGLLTIAFVGEFSVGKTSLVNRALGESILPTDVTPTTGVITRVRYGANRELSLSRQSGTQTYKDNEIMAGSNELTLEAGSKINAAVLSHPSMQELVEIIDTPGVNDLRNSDASVLYNLLPECDGIVLVLSASAVLKKSEAIFLKERLFSVSRSCLSIVINGLDRVREAPDQIAKAARTRLLNTLGPSGLDAGPIWVVSAKQNSAFECLPAQPSVSLPNCGAALIERLAAKIQLRREDGKRERTHFLLKTAEAVLLNEIQSLSDPLKNGRRLSAETLDKLRSLAARTRKDAVELAKARSALEKEMHAFLDAAEKEAVQRCQSVEDPIEYKNLLQTWLISTVEQWDKKIVEQWAKFTTTEVVSGATSPPDVDNIPRSDANAGLGPLEEWISKPLNQIIAFTTIPFVIGTLGLYGLAALVALPFIEQHLMQEKLAEARKEQFIAIRSTIGELRDRLESALRLTLVQKIKWVAVNRIWECKTETRLIRQALAPSVKVADAERLLSRVRTVLESADKLWELVN
ncbi:dynamin family protein [Bdellovibrionota bacterium FG-1]